MHLWLSGVKRSLRVRTIRKSQIDKFCRDRSDFDQRLAGGMSKFASDNVWDPPDAVRSTWQPKSSRFTRNSELDRYRLLKDGFADLERGHKAGVHFCKCNANICVT